MTPRAFIVAVTVLVSVLPLIPVGEAAAQNRESYLVEARPVDRAPRVDGNLDDAIWATANAIDRFVQQEPNEGEPATERTEVRILYDSRHLFIGVRAFDSSPAAIVATEMRRDSDRILDEDNFQLILDAFEDRRSGYMFVTNPLGAKLEQQISEEGEGNTRGNNSNVNRNWDGVWDAAARQTADGWTAEIVIPMTTLRFKEVEAQRWGINFMRNIRRKNEQVFWAPIPKAYSVTRVSLAGTLTGLQGLNQGMDLRLKPFVIGGIRDRRPGTLANVSGLRDAGLDVKYGVMSSFNLDFTVNTDFAQVEVDEQQVNLTRFSLFFPEKRDFFLENAGQFNMGAQTQDADLFFSRRIGLSETGQPIPILGGARLTGKLGPHNLALLNIQTDTAGGRQGENFLVTRYSRDVLARSRIGGIFINKETAGGSHFNRTMGADASLALGRSLMVNSFLAKTSSPGVTGGDLAFYNRVAYRNQAWNLYAYYLDIQDNFNAEVGFVPRRGIRTTKVYFSPTPRPGRFGIRMMEPMVVVTYTTDQQNRLLTRVVHHMLGVSLKNGAFLNAIYNRNFEQLDEPFRVQRDVTVRPGPYRFGELVLTYNSDPSKRLYQRITYSPQAFYDGTRKDLSVAVGLRATSQFSAEASYRLNNVDLPTGAFEVHLTGLKLDYTLSPRTTVRSYIQFNSLTQELNTSVRLNLIYRPGSDLYLVYNDLRETPGREFFPRDRQLVLKLNYLISR